MSSDALPVSTFYPDIRDPRVSVTIERGRRPAIASLWALAERLALLLREAREPMICQIKLAWWRDMMAKLATDADALPKGEPLLAQLSAQWRGQSGLDQLVDGAEGLLLAETSDERCGAAAAFGDALFKLSGASGGGERWGMVWASCVQQDEAAFRDLLEAACNHSAPSRERHGTARALLILDRWAHMIACRGGERHWRAEGFLLLRLGIFGR